MAEAHQGECAGGVVTDFPVLLEREDEGDMFRFEVALMEFDEAEIGDAGDFGKGVSGTPRFLRGRAKRRARFLVVSRLREVAGPNRRQFSFEHHSTLWKLHELNGDSVRVLHPRCIATRIRAPFDPDRSIASKRCSTAQASENPVQIVCHE